MSLLDDLKSLNFAQLDTEVQKALQVSVDLAEVVEGPLGSLLHLSAEEEDFVARFVEFAQAAEKLLNEVPTSLTAHHEGGEGEGDDDDDDGDGG